MNGTFIGKWRLYIPTTQVPGYSTDGWAAYEPSGGLEPPDLWCPWYTYNVVDGKKVGPYPPGIETDIAFILREDGELCFLLNNGKYVYYIFDFVFVDTLDEASGFIFPGHDFRNLTPSFNSYIQTANGLMCLPEGGQVLISGCQQQFAIPFAISQVTPSLDSLPEQKGDGCDFAWVDFSNVKVFIEGASFVKADFSNCNLTNAYFGNCNFTGANLTNANLSGVRFSYCTLDGAVLDNCNLHKTKFTCSSLHGTHIENAIFWDTDLSLAHLVGIIIKKGDLISTTFDAVPEFYNKPLAPPSPDNPRTVFSGCRFNQSQIGNDWSMLDLTGATIQYISSPLSSPTNPLKANYSILSGLILTGQDDNSFVGLSLQSAVFDYAVLDGLGFNSSGDQITDLSGASFIQASMHGTNFSGAILKGANLTGAQLGSLGKLFTLPTTFVADLNAGPNVDAALRTQFTQHGITLSTTATVSIQSPNRVWQLDDLGTNTIYTIRLETNADNLTVYTAATSANLTDAYMPDAVLTGANLYGVLASRVQFYGAAARVDSFAILECAEFNDANLSSLNLTQANLFGANLSGAQLFNAKFNGAKLSPSANNVATNLTGANLQGADFTSAQLDWANLENAAVAIKVPTKATPDQGGVYLFSLPYSSKDVYWAGDYINELNAAATSLFSLNPDGDAATLQKYVIALQTNNLSVLKVPFIQHKITLSAAAQIETVPGEATVWQIVDGRNSYTLWEALDEDGNTELYAALSLTITRTAFQVSSSMPLRWQATVAVDAPGQQWLLDNDSENPKNFSTGYVRFILTLDQSGRALNVYGAAVRVERLGDKQQLQMDTETCNVTALAVTNMNPQTICPNGTKVSDQASAETWEMWLRAPKLPAPPTCVPTDYYWCPPAAKTKE